MSALTEKNVKKPFLVKIDVGQSSMQFFPSLIFKNDRILRIDDSFSSFNIYRKLHPLRFFN